MIINRLLAPFCALLLLALSPAVFAAESGDYRSPETVEGTTTVDASEVKEMAAAGAIIVDVRNPRLFARRHVPGAIHLDLKTAYNREALAKVAGKQDKVVLYCSGVKCARSYRAAQQAVSWGYENVYYFRDGIVEWRKAGYPVESGK